MKTLIENLKAEHQYILKQIELLEKNPCNINKSNLISLFEFIEKIHHEKEETLLFSHIANKEWLKQGGPFCGYFMGIRLDLNPIDKIKSHLQKFYQETNQSAPLKKQFVWLTSQNPISIPMEEHDLGHQLSSGLIFLLNNSENDCSENVLFKLLLNDYLELIKAHIQKEDMCLFSQCLIKLY